MIQILKRKKNKYHFLVEKFIKEPKKLKPKDWARETKIAQKLYEKYNNERFWKGSLLNFKLNSLAWFLSEDGLKFLESNYLILKLRLPKNKKIALNDEAIESQIEFENKVKTTLDFLNSEEIKK